MKKVKNNEGVTGSELHALTTHFFPIWGEYVVWEELPDVDSFMNCGSRYGVLNWDYVGEGTHWYAYILSEDFRELTLFDPLGYGADKELVDLCVEAKLRLTSVHGGQTPNPEDGDDVCGVYCVWWLCMCALGIEDESDKNSGLYAIDAVKECFNL